MKYFFIRLYCILFKDVIKFKVDDETYKRIFITDRENNADLYRYTNLGKNLYLIRPKKIYPWSR
jgi:hypothetical protein